MTLPLLREPLLHFLVLGATLFGIYSLAERKNPDAPGRIVIPSAQVANLADGFARTWRRKPNQGELQNLVEEYIRDEVFYREGRAAGLDRDDPIIRRRVRQKMEFSAEDLSATEPTEEQLAAHLNSHADRFKTDDLFSFRQIFLSTTRRANTIDSDSRQLANALAREDHLADATTLGDPFLLGEEFGALAQRDIASTFGERFSKRLAGMEEGRWQGPIPSSFGQHFVFISKRTTGSLPSLDSVRQDVRREWSNAHRLEAEQSLYRSLRGRYEIIVEAPPANATLAEASQ